MKLPAFDQGGCIRNADLGQFTVEPFRSLMHVRLLDSGITQGCPLVLDGCATKCLQPASAGV